MFKIDDIKVGNVLGLKAKMSGYYQVVVKDVSAVYTTQSGRKIMVTVSAWRYDEETTWTETTHTQMISENDSLVLIKESN